MGVKWDGFEELAGCECKQTIELDGEDFWCMHVILLMQLWAVGQTEDKAEHKVCATGQTVKPLFTRTFFSPRYCWDAGVFLIFVVLSLQFQPLDSLVAEVTW